MIKKQAALVLLMGLILPALLLGKSINITPLGEWGHGHYYSVFPKGNYAYCHSSLDQLDIIDISNPANPCLAGEYEPGKRIGKMMAAGNYLYLWLNNHGLSVVDITEPLKPREIGNYLYDEGIRYLSISGNYLFFGESMEISVLDISNPALPSFKKKYDLEHQIDNIFIEGTTAYMNGQAGTVNVMDISNPLNMTELGHIELPKGHRLLSIDVKDNLAAISLLDSESVDCEIINYFSHFYTVDLSNLQDPVLLSHKRIDYEIRGLIFYGEMIYASNNNTNLGIIELEDKKFAKFTNFPTTGNAFQFKIVGTYLYLADGIGGLQIFNISSPAEPVEIGNFSYSDYYNSLLHIGNYLYAAGYNNGLLILDTSNPAVPEPVETIKSLKINDMVLNGKYLHVTGIDNTVKTLDVSNPVSPKVVDSLDIGTSVESIELMGNYLIMLAPEKTLFAVDISNPAAMVQIGSFEWEYSIHTFCVDGTNIYLRDHNRIAILDGSNPRQFRLSGAVTMPFIFADFYVSGDYALCCTRNSFNYFLKVYDISNPPVPIEKWCYPMDRLKTFDVKENYAYVTHLSGIFVLDITTFHSPRIAGFSKDFQECDRTVACDNILVTRDNKKFYFSKFNPVSTPPQLLVDKYKIDLGVIVGNYSGLDYSERVYIKKFGEGKVNWRAQPSRDDQYWLGVDNDSGTDNGFIEIYLKKAIVGPDRPIGIVFIQSSEAVNAPVSIEVKVIAKYLSDNESPFGEFSTPIYGVTVSGSVPFTGWALDDQGIKEIAIYRETLHGLAPVGHGIQVEGARGDIVTLYPGYPMLTRAGWGYMMLTNMLPDGDGQYRFHAIATDWYGKQTTLGVKTVTVNNRDAKRPFGAIDTPEQGGMAEGNQYVNFGWALTPQPAKIYESGEGISVWLDGVNLGQPVYNVYRKDIASLFPGYANSQAAGGYFYLDTTAYENGLHTISWLVKDNRYNQDGVGSRYFMIQNEASQASTVQDTGGGMISAEQLEHIRRAEECFEPVEAVTGYNDEPLQPVEWNEAEERVIVIPELGRVELHLGAPVTSGFLKWGENYSPLPPGSTLDKEKGIFYFQPGVGYVGDYIFEFFFKPSPHSPELEKKQIKLRIKPRFESQNKSRK